MIHRDLKIGLVLGLVLVIIIVFKLATNPDLSPESRWQLQSTADVQENGVSPNNISQDFIIGEIPWDSQQQELLPLKSLKNVIAQNEQLQNLFSPREQPRKPQTEIVEHDESFEKEVPPVEVTERTYANEAVEPVQMEKEPFDYDSAEIIKTEKFHIVRKNQTLSEISRIYYGSVTKWQKIVDANPDVIKDPNKIKVGMKLIIPD